MLLHLLLILGFTSPQVWSESESLAKGEGRVEVGEYGGGEDVDKEEEVVEGGGGVEGADGEEEVVERG